MKRHFTDNIFLFIRIQGIFIHLVVGGRVGEMNGRSITDILRGRVRLAAAIVDDYDWKYEQMKEFLDRREGGSGRVLVVGSCSPLLTPLS
jgi:hypothetical protein